MISDTGMQYLPLYHKNIIILLKTKNYLVTKKKQEFISKFIAKKINILCVNYFQRTDDNNSFNFGRWRTHILNIKIIIVNNL